MFLCYLSSFFLYAYIQVYNRQKLGSNSAYFLIAFFKSLTILQYFFMAEPFSHKRIISVFVKH